MDNSCGVPADQDEVGAKIEDGEWVLAKNSAASQNGKPHVVIFSNQNLHELEWLIVWYALVLLLY